MRLGLTLGTLFLLTSYASADIVGFGDFSGWQVNVGDPGPLYQVDIVGGWIKLTTQGNTEARSIFNETQQVVSQFAASFTYWTDNTHGIDHGAAFVIQRSPDGPFALGSPGFALGYGGNSGANGIANSLAVSLELGSGGTYSGVYSNGVVGGIGDPTAPIDFRNGNHVDVTLSYNGAILHETLFDPVLQASFDRSYPLDIPAIIGGDAAYIGLTASTDYGGGTNQYFSNFRFSSVPEPATHGLLSLLALAVWRRRSS